MNKENNQLTKLEKEIVSTFANKIKNNKKELTFDYRTKVCHILKG